MNRPHTPATPIGVLSNGGVHRYLLEAVSTTGFMAWRLADGTTFITEAINISLPPSPQVTFWSCAGFNNSTPAGEVVALDCHDNALTQLKIATLTRLRFLDCSFNRLTELELTGLFELQAVDADSNRLTRLEITGLHTLRLLNCARNQIEFLDSEAMRKLEVLDVAGNPMTSGTSNKPRIS